MGGEGRGGGGGGKGVEGEGTVPKLALTFRLSKTVPDQNWVSDRNNRSRWNRKAYPGRFLIGSDRCQSLLLKKTLLLVGLGGAGQRGGFTTMIGLLQCKVYRIWARIHVL